MKKSKIFLIVYLYCLFSLIFLGITHSFVQDTIYWVTANGTDDWYVYPLTKYIGVAGYSLIGQSFFYLFSFTIFFSAIFVLRKLQLENSLNEKLFWIIFLASSFSFKAIATFQRDNIIFLLGSLYALEFFRILNNKRKKPYFLLLINVSMFFFREIAIIFLILTVSIILIKKTKLEKVFFGAIPFLFEKTWKDLTLYWGEGLKTAMKFQPENLFRITYNPIFVVSIIFFFLRPNKWHFYIILLTVLFCYPIANHSEFAGSVFRYSYSLIPLHLYFLSKNRLFVKKSNNPN